MSELQRQQEALNSLLSKFPKRYQASETEYLRALLAGLSVGDGFISSQVEAVRDNLFAVTASGRFLDRTAGTYGVVRGQGAGILDVDFRKIVPIMGASPKQISSTLLQIIDIIYGPYASHANTTATSPSPYSLSVNQSLIIKIDNTIIDVTFGPEDAATLASATAEEVAIAISQKTQGKAIGSVLTDARTGNQYVNIRTATIGSQGFVQVIGGDAQAKLRFPEVRPVSMTLATYSVSNYLGTDEMIYTVTAGAAPDFIVAGVQKGDFVNIRDDSGFDVSNTGTFEVTFAGSGFFRVKNGSGVSEAGITLAHLDDFTFFKPNLANVLLSARPAALIETSNRELTVILPVTSPVVKRTLFGGHHFHQGVTGVLGTTVNTIAIGSTNGFATAGAVTPTLSRKIARGVVSTIGATTVTLIDGANWPTKGSFYAANTRSFYYFSGRVGNQLTGVTPAPASLSGAPIIYAERYSYSGITGSTLTGVYPDPTGLTGFEVSATGALTNSNFPGSFMYDPQAKYIAAQNASFITETVRQGSVKTLLQIDDVAAWPESGHFVLERGTSKEESVPIRYLAKIGTKALIIDPSHVFEKDHLSGVSIRLVRQIGAYIPKNDGSDYAVYTTSTSPARDLLMAYLKQVAASGVRLKFVIQVPSQKWPLLPNLYTTDPLGTTIV